LKYAIARGALQAVVPIMGVALVVDVLLHGDQSLVSIVEERGWMYLTVACLAVVAHAKRGSWLESLDRRFFRERYDAQRLLRDIADQARRVAHLEQVSPLVVQRVTAALHPRANMLLVREPDQALFRALESEPTASVPALAIRTDNKVIEMLRLLGRPFDISGSGAAWSQLPQVDAVTFRDAGEGVPVVVEGG
jgi:hypothetical protein